VPAPPRPRRKRAEPRLDPVRWRRPGRGTLIRMIAVAVLLSVGAAAAWSRPPACAPPTKAAGPSTGAAPPAKGGTPPTPEKPAGSPPWPGRSEGPAGAAADERQVTGNMAERPGGDEQSGHPVPPGRVGVPVRLADPTALALVHPGDQVDLLSVDGTGHGATAVVTGAPVLDVTGPDEPTTGGLLVALRPAEARTAVAVQGSGFAVLIRPASSP
jgi:hypothetical protein